MKFEICIHCFNYQRRLDWMLSSILQQKGDVPDIIINISHIIDNGNPTTENLITFFRDKGLDIVSTVIDSDDSNNRSIARRKQLNDTEADWIIFADSDMVYSTLFFQELTNQVESEQFKNEEKCIGADRISLNIPFCIDFFSSDTNEYPIVIENVEDKVKSWPVYRVGGKTIAAGYFQLANVRLIRERNLEYPVKRYDGLRTYKADRAFRCVLGGRVGMDLPPQYHLNHSRENLDGMQH